MHALLLSAEPTSGHAADAGYDPGETLGKAGMQTWFHALGSGAVE
jgi:hypothetical protein